MKLFFYRYGSICEPDVIDSFQHLGFEVHEETAEMTNKSLLPAQCVELVAPQLISGNYTFVFSINFFPWLSDLCNVTKIPYLCLIVDSPVLELYSKSLRNPYNRIFLFDWQLYEEFHPKNPDGVFHIPLATNVRRTDALRNSTPIEEKKKFAADISFIGSTYQEKCPYNNVKLPERERGYVDGIVESQLKIYGYNFIEDMLSDDFVETFLAGIPNFEPFPEGFEMNYKALVAQHYISVKVAEQERIRFLKALSDRFSVDIYTGSDMSEMPHIHNRGFAKSLTEMPLIFEQSKINLNMTAKSIRSGLSLRIFDVLGCGGFLITNYQAELAEAFEIGKDLVAYESQADLEEKCAYYLTHEEERMEITRHGYETVKKYHSYDIRIVQMLELAFGKDLKS